MIGTFGEQPIDECRIDTVRREHRFSDALRRILIEIETGGAERKIEIGHDRIEIEVARDGEGDIVRDGGGADAALGPDHRDDAADRLGVRRREQSADRAHDLQRADRRDQVIAHAAPHQLAIERDVVHGADDDDARAGVAIIRELIERAQDVLAAVLRFKNDDVGRRRTLIGFDRRRQASHLNAQVRLAHAPVLAGRLDCGGGIDVLAEGLYRNARRRRDVLFAHGGGGTKIVLSGLTSLVHRAPTLPVALLVALLADIADFGRLRIGRILRIAGLSPAVYFWNTVVRRIV